MGGYEVVKVGTDEHGGVDVDDLRAKADDRRRLPDAHQPEHARACSTATSRRSPRSSTASARRCTTTARTSTRSWAARARATWASTSCTSTCTRRSRSRTAAAARAPGRSRCRDRIEPYLPQAAGRQARRRHVRPRLRPAEVDRPPARLPGQLRRLRALLRVHPLARRRRPAGGVRDRGPERQLPAGEADASSASTEQLPPAYDRLCMHEFVLSGAPMKRELGLRTLDLAKRLLDHGFHPPTVYFPLLVDEALLIEPTETETKETLDAVRRGDRGDPARGRRGPGDRPQRAVRDAGPPARRGGRRQAPGHPPAAV